MVISGDCGDVYWGLECQMGPSSGFSVSDGGLNVSILVSRGGIHWHLCWWFVGINIFSLDLSTFKNYAHIIWKRTSIFLSAGFFSVCHEKYNSLPQISVTLYNNLLTNTVLGSFKSQFQDLFFLPFSKITVIHEQCIIWMGVWKGKETNIPFLHHTIWNQNIPTRPYYVVARLILPP